MLKFMAGLVIGLFAGAYIAISIPELPQILSWASLVTLL